MGAFARPHRPVAGLLPDDTLHGGKVSAYRVAPPPFE
jgi:hypothetical protein